MYLTTLNGTQGVPDGLLAAMFEARKRIFVDMLGWDVPVLAGRYEIDQFDDPRAIYLILSDECGKHLGSARLLETERPHILDTLFPDLCEDAVPKGPTTREITRFALDPRQNARQRRRVRDTLVCALTNHALASGVEAYTGVAEIAWLQQILAFGWDCEPLGLPREKGASLLGALRIAITHETPMLLASAGLVAEPVATPHTIRHAA
ncbi:acyl-homoserine-lactone synthase [Croceicoccus hydrothermalis]|jgi:N-acyl-L-homoserine lactone synthetase|uniref:acyl-homoserine-lactone synthase n=1 Tax=Croceicoccus hydrothermalis TaxID=2867964 RepID=UPI001EFC2436|nr:acyl-homoserine-lactone synthase [Croceicoccus hydrothermalis]